jgi:guanylate kinase
MSDKVTYLDLPLAEREPPPLLIVLSGPSGVGKDTIIERMRERDLPFYYTVTATTRSQRENEVHGVHYLFVSNQEFNELFKQGELLENATVYGNSYGIPKSGVRAALAQGEDVIMKPDVQGAAHLKRVIPDAVFIFIAPASLEELTLRLMKRGSETPETLARRLSNYHLEMKAAGSFDYYVINREGRLDETVDNILAILRAEKSRVTPRQVRL